MPSTSRRKPSRSAWTSKGVPKPVIMRAAAEALNAQYFDLRQILDRRFADDTQNTRVLLQREDFHVAALEGDTERRIAGADPDIGGTGEQHRCDQRSAAEQHRFGVETVSLMNTQLAGDPDWLERRCRRSVENPDALRRGELSRRERCRKKK